LRLLKQIVKMKKKSTQKIGLRHPNLKAQQAVIKSHPVQHNRPKNRKTRHTKTYMASPINSNGLSSGTDH
jgi:hypothetical protein